MKKKISVEVDEELLEWIRSGIEKKRFASTSHAVNYALNEMKKRESQ
jgi:Arc/MetJ-type ribon-helix-helix transcriptional regulator